MGRTQTFETPAVVAAARDVFWRLGYDGTSLGDLERATALGRSSLYHAFGSKRGLFEAAVENYLDLIVRPRLAPLVGGGGQPADAARNALVDYFAEMADAVAGSEEGDERAGCLLLISTAGQAGRDTTVRGAVDAYRAELAEAFAAALGRALPGAVADDIECRARLFTALVVAGLTLARVNRGEAVETLRLARDLAAELPGAAG